jgi:hypothetical protein
MVNHSSFVEERAHSLGDALLSLDEPWKSRFPDLVANEATGCSWNDKETPTYEELVSWLTDSDIYRRTMTLLNVWQGMLFYVYWTVSLK